MLPSEKLNVWGGTRTRGMWSVESRALLSELGIMSASEAMPLLEQDVCQNYFVRYHIDSPSLTWLIDMVICVQCKYRIKCGH